MNTRSRITRSLGAVLLLGGALLTVALGATAAAANTTPRAAAETELIPPTLTEATYGGDNVVGLHWDPSASADDTVSYDIFANGRFVEQVDAPLFGAAVLLDRTGATPDAEFTVAAVDAAGNVSAPSNGLVPINERPLPAPTAISAVITGDKVTFSWKPTVTEASSVTYFIVVDTDVFGRATDRTSVTLDRSQRIEDPSAPHTRTVQPGSSVQIFAMDSDGLQSPRSNEIFATLG